MLKSSFRKPFLVLLVTALLATGCTQQAPEPFEEEAPVEQEIGEETPVEQEAEAEVPQEEEGREELPESVKTTILIEGMEEDMTLRLFHEEAMPFYTYYPGDMISEHWIYDNEKGVRFFASFGGTINESAYVEIRLFPVENLGTEADFINFISGEAGLLENERLFPWSIIEFYYLDDEFTGSVYLGQHEDTYFYIDVHYPWEYGDGMESRAHLIMKEFFWTEQQQGLTE